MEKLETFLADDQPVETGIQVLLIEDNPADARLFKEYLTEDETHLYVLSHVETIGEALEAVGQDEPDVIVLDLSLPDAQGLEGLCQIAEAASVPVVVHSGVDDRHMIAEAVKQGAQDYLVKGRYDAELLDRVIGYAIDRQQTLRVVQNSEKRLRSIIEHTSDGVVIVCPEGKVVFANPAAEALLGSSTDELLGTPFGFPLTTDETVELKIVNKEGRSVTVETRTTPILWECQTAFLASMRDITAHKQLQDHLTHAKEKAEELARLKSSFLASMSHELRTPLTGVMGFADTLIRELDHGQHREFATIIKQAGDRLLATINSVLDLSQLEAGTVKVKKRPVRVNELAQEVLALLDPLAKGKGLSIGLTTYAPETVVQADKILLQRILDNLVGNAIKFTDAGSVVVEIEAKDRLVYIRVKDTGQGIDPSFMPYLFDQFSQESDGLRRSHPGSGLGLAITKKLVTLLDGTITVESDVGVGSTFTISLPVVEHTSASRIPHFEPLRPPADQQRLRVLVAEDNDQTRQLIQHILEPHYDVTAVADGETALDLLKNTAYDALLLDIQLAGQKTGVDVLNTVRADGDHQKTPAVAVTAFSVPGDQPYFLEEIGFDGYLRKPFTRDQLLNTLQKAMTPHMLPFPRETHRSGTLRAAS